MLSRRRISLVLEKANGIEVVQECSNGRNAITQINALKPDLVFLDVNLKDINGFQVLLHTQVSPKPMVIYISAQHQHALKAFDFEGFDFLLKPFSEARFLKTLEKAREVFKTRSNVMHSKIREEIFNSNSTGNEEKNSICQLPIRIGNKTLLLKTSSIRYIIASGYYAEIYTRDKKHIIRESLGNLIETLNQGNFFRVHRSAIVNIKYIQEIVHSNYSEIDVRMKDKKLIRISKPNKKEFLAKLGF